MKILADENFPRSVVEVLKAQAHDVVWARLDCPGEKDRSLLERAELEGRVVFTLDKDFIQIAVRRRVPLKAAGIVLIRVHPAIPREIELLVQIALRSASKLPGNVSIVTKNGIETFPAG
ncbi:MAG: DUF5615 family PIN-like protein [Bryobacteraceae bacterium]